MQTQSVYEVTELSRGGIQNLVEVELTGQAPIRNLRKKYPFFTRFVLKGFNINGIFVPLKLRHR